MQIISNDFRYDEQNKIITVFDALKRVQFPTAFESVQYELIGERSLVV